MCLLRSNIQFYYYYSAGVRCNANFRQLKGLLDSGVNQMLKIIVFDLRTEFPYIPHFENAFICHLDLQYLQAFYPINWLIFSNSFGDGKKEKKRK